MSQGEESGVPAMNGDTLVSSARAVKVQEYSTIERFRELLLILSNDRHKLRAGDIKNKWSTYLQLFVPKDNWLALWNNLLVDVVRVDFNNFTAQAQVLEENHDEKEEPALVEVPLLALFPTEQQVRDEEDEQYDFSHVAASLDHLRYFYKDIWKPWDLQDDETTDWVGDHLFARIQLQRENENSKVLHRLEALANESKVNQMILQTIQSDMDSCDSEDKEFKEEDVAEYFDLTLREYQIRKEAELLENPVIRTVMESVKRKKKKANHPDEPITIAVWPGGPVAELEAFIGQVKKLDDGTPDHLRVCESLSEALAAAMTGDTIFLPEGIHNGSGFSDLDGGGSIIGIGDREKIVVLDLDSTDVMFPIAHEESEAVSKFSNLKINISGDASVFTVRSGRLVIENCVVSGKVVGVEVLEDGVAEIVDSVIENSGNCVEVVGSGKLVATDTKFINSKTGIFLVDGKDCHLTLKNVEIKNNSEFGVLIQKVEDKKVEDVEDLATWDNVNLEKCCFKGNAKDVAVDL